MMYYFAVITKYLLRTLDFSEKDPKALALTKQWEGNVCCIQMSCFLYLQ